MTLMDDLETRFDDFPFLQGVDLTLWVQVVVALLVLAAAAAAAVGVLT